MKQFFAFVKKEFYHIFRDVRTIMILLGIPIVQIVLFGFAISTEVKNAKIAFYDISRDASTQRIKKLFAASPYFHVVKELTGPTQVNEAFKDGSINLVIVFNENFANNLFHSGEATVQLLADGTDPNQATMLVNYASNIIGSYRQELIEEMKIPLQIVPEVRMLYNPQMKGAFNFVPGVMGMILILICAMMTSISIVREKETGTMEVILASPVKPIYIILAKAVPYFTLSVMNLITILLLSVFVLKVPIAGSLFWLIAVSLLFIVLALSLGLLVSTLVDTQIVAMLIAGMVLIMPVMLLSGLIFPVESMAPPLQVISCIVPARWYIEAVRRLMIQGVEIQFVWKEILILLSMTVALLTISLKKFKPRLE